MLMSGFDAYFLEVSAHALLKIATKGSFGGEKSENLAFLTIFLKWRSTTKVNYVFSHTYFLEVSPWVSEHNILVAIGGSEWEVN